LPQKSRFLSRKANCGTERGSEKGCFLCGTDGSNPFPSSGESQAPKPTDFGSFAEFERVMIRANALGSRKIEASASVPCQASEQT